MDGLLLLFMQLFFAVATVDWLLDAANMLHFFESNDCMQSIRKSRRLLPLLSIRLRSDSDDSVRDTT